MGVWNDPTRRRWIIWAVVSLVFVLVNINRLSSAVLAEELMRAFRTTGVQLGTLHAMFFYIYALMQIPSGLLADRIGPRKTVTAGALTMNIGAIWFAFANTYAAALVARGLVGLGGSVIFICLLRLCASWYRPDEFGRMSGLCFAVAGFGGILATTPLAIVATATGWRTTIAVLGIFGLVLAIAVYVLVHDSPEQAGFDPIRDVPAQPAVSNADLRHNTISVLRDPVTWAAFVMLFCVLGTVLTLIGLWGVPYVVQTHGVSVTQASVVTLLGGLGVMVGPPAVGWLSDRLGRRVDVIVVSGVIYVVALGSLAVFETPPIALVGFVFVLTGFLLGGYVLCFPIVKDRHPTGASGISTGTINGGGFVGAAILPTLMGLALDVYWTGDFVGGVRVYTATGYRMAFAIATVAGIVALVCALWLYRLDDVH